MQLYKNLMNNPASGRLVKAEPLTNTTSRLYLDSGFEVDIQGRIKDLRAVYFGDKIEGFYVHCNRKMQMTPEHWEQIQPLLLKETFSPLIDERLKLSYSELETLPRLLWTTDMAREKRKQQVGELYLYHPINFWKSSYNPEKPDEPVIKCALRDFRDGKMYLWAVAANLETDALAIEHEVFNSYLYLV